MAKKTKFLKKIITENNKKGIEDYIRNEEPVPEELIKEKFGKGFDKEEIALVYNSFKFVEEEFAKLPEKYRFRDDGVTPILEHAYGTAEILDGTGALSKTIAQLHDFFEVMLEEKYDELNSEEYIFNKIREISREKADINADFLIENLKGKKSEEIADLINSGELKEHYTAALKTFDVECILNINALKKKEFLDYYKELQNLIKINFGSEVLEHLNLLTNYYDMEIIYNLNLEKELGIDKEHLTTQKWLDERQDFLIRLSLARRDKMINFMLFIDNIVDSSFKLYEKERDDNLELGYRNSLASIYAELGDKIHNIMSVYPTDLQKKKINIKKIDYILHELEPHIHKYSSQGVKLSQTHRLVQRLIDETDKQIEKIIEDMKERYIEKDKLDYWKNVQKQFGIKYHKLRDELYNNYITALLDSVNENGLNEGIWIDRFLVEINSCEKNLKRDNPINYSIHPISRSYELIFRLTSLLEEKDPNKKSLVFKKTKDLFSRAYKEAKDKWIESNYLCNKRKDGEEEYGETRSLLKSFKKSFYNMKKFYG